jgi:hypothetical protein
MTTIDELFDKFKTHDEEVLKVGTQCLEKQLGKLRAEHFLQLSYMHRLHKAKGLDYTQWRNNNLWNNMTVEEISQQAANFRKKQQQKQKQVELNTNLVEVSL